MSSQILVVIVLIAAAALFVLWVRRNDRARSEPDPVDDKIKGAGNGNR